MIPTLLWTEIEKAGEDLEDLYYNVIYIMAQLAGNLPLPCYPIPLSLFTILLRLLLQFPVGLALEANESRFLSLCLFVGKREYGGNQLHVERVTMFHIYIYIYVRSFQNPYPSIQTSPTSLPIIHPLLTLTECKTARPDLVWPGRVWSGRVYIYIYKNLQRIVCMY